MCYLNHISGTMITISSMEGGRGAPGLAYVQRYAAASHPSQQQLPSRTMFTIITTPAHPHDGVDEEDHDADCVDGHNDSHRTTALGLRGHVAAETAPRHTGPHAAGTAGLGGRKAR